ncbi:hypothetical protein AHAS_Ahas09G0148100 [Arachis hypogaea]
MGPVVYQPLHNKCWLYHLGWFYLKEKETKDTADYSVVKHYCVELLMQQSTSTAGSALEHMKRTHEAVNKKESKHISATVSLISNASNSNEQHDMEINSTHVAVEEDVAKNSKDLFKQFDGAAPLPRFVEEFMRVISGSTLSKGYVINFDI